MSIYDENEKDDYFEDTDVPEEKPKPEKKPRLKPDDPRYWEEPEDDFEHLRPSGRSYWKFWCVLAAVAIVVGIVWGGYVMTFSAYVVDATQYGYVESIDKRGDVIKTYEGVLLPYKNLMDTTRVYDGDFVFSSNNPSVAARLAEMQIANRPVRVTYKVYHTAMPWRGDSKIQVVSVDSVDERDILPPDRQPARVTETVNEPAAKK